MRTMLLKRSVRTTTRSVCRARVLGGLAAGALALASHGAAAWGPNGHKAVGGMADQLIAGTPTAKKVRAILGSDLATAAGWADCARSVESQKTTWVYTKRGTYGSCLVYENPASEKLLIDFVKRNASRCGGWASSEQCRHKAYHFVDLSIEQDRYELGRPGTAENDLVHAINATVAVLQGRKSPPPFDIRTRKEALRLLVHYLGDLHQPLHVGSIYLDDAGRPMDPATAEEAREHGNAGGNLIELEDKKLHAIWDDVSDTLLKQLLGGQGAAEARKLLPGAGSRAPWAADWTTTWASDTVVAARKAYKGLKFGPKVTTPAGSEWRATAAEPAYRRAREALQREQLIKGGARLAQVLNAVWP